MASRHAVSARAGRTKGAVSFVWAGKVSRVLRLACGSRSSRGIVPSFPRQSVARLRGPAATLPLVWYTARAMADDAPKTAYELAMERLRKKDGEASAEDRPLTDTQKAAIAEIRQ